MIPGAPIPIDPLPAHPLPAKSLVLEAATSLDTANLLPRLRAALEAADIWVGGPQPHLRNASLRIELHRRAVPSLYTLLIASGLDLTRTAHTALATLCSRRHLVPSGVFEITLDLRGSVPSTGTTAT